MTTEWIYYALMAASGLIGWLARPMMQPASPPTPSTPATPSPSPTDHPILRLLLAQLQGPVLQAIHDAVDKALQEAVKPPPVKQP